MGSCFPVSAPQLGRKQLSPAAHSRTSFTSSLRSPVVRISCCGGATTSGGSAATSAEDGDVGLTSSSHFGDVFVASIPLRAPQGIVRDVLEFTKDVEFLADFQHFMTIIKPTGDGDNGGPCTVLDFQPKYPEDPMTAIAVLMGRSIPGVLQERTLSRIPNQRCWWVGKMHSGLSLKDAVDFHRQYNTELSLGINDCRHHTLDLVEYFTGKSMSYIEEVRIIQEQELGDAPEDNPSETPEHATVETVEKSAEESTVNTAT